MTRHETQPVEPDRLEGMRDLLELIAYGIEAVQSGRVVLFRDGGLTIDEIRRLRNRETDEQQHLPGRST
jgi:hypothetical protein